MRSTRRARLRTSGRSEGRRGSPARSAGPAMTASIGAALAWPGAAAPALAVVVAFFIAPLLMSAVVAFRGKAGGFTLEHFAKSFDLYTTDLLFTLAIVLLSTVLIGLVVDRDRRLPDARRESARGRAAALALPLAAVHSVRRRRAGDADLPRQERHAQPCADRQRADRAACRRKACSTGAASSSPSSGSRRRS